MIKKQNDFTVIDIVSMIVELASRSYDPLLKEVYDSEAATARAISLTKKYKNMAITMLKNGCCPMGKFRNKEFEEVVQNNMYGRLQLVK